MLNRKNKTIIFAISMFVFGLTNCIIALGGEVYVAAPIVFVHGINSGDYTWTYTKNELGKYFINTQTGELKYEYTNSSAKPFTYFPFCTYEWMNTGDIPTIANELLSVYIWGAQQAIPQDCPNKKVNLVTHSMGGLITRSLLKKERYKNDINRVVFIGTPHTGSPHASALWLLDKVKNEKLPELMKESGYHSKAVFTSNDFSRSEQIAYMKLARNLKSRYDHISFLLNTSDATGLKPQSPAINQLRLNQDVDYYDVVFGIEGDKVVTAEVTASYLGADTFLAAGNNNLGMPVDFKTIAGENTNLNLKLWATNKFLGLGNAFTFPAGETFNEVYANGGDGVVSLGSQRHLGNAITIEGINHLTEPQQAQAILNALDDSPIIENMRVLSANRYANGPGYFVYVIARVKDYLLADIAISSMTVDANPINLSEFDDGVGHYKPYVKFKKNLLKERPDSSVLDKDGNVVTLKPGEFYVRLYLEGNDPHVVNIDLRNPSDNPYATASLTIQRPIIDNESPTGTITNTRPTIEAQIQSPMGVDIYSNSLAMKINGSVVSHTTSGSGPNINIHYTPNNDLDDGQYTVTVDGKDINGIPAEQKEWTFTIQTQRPIITNEAPKGDIINARPTISARIYSPVGTSINLSSLDLKLDSYTVSHSTPGSGSDITVSYDPPSDLNSATHTVHLYGQDINGLSVSKTWTFAIKPGYFIVEIPSKISIGQDFTMKVTACSGLGQVMDGQDGRELYNENADITISGDPSPQGNLVFTHINAGEWVNGAWQVSNQRYTNNTENKYKLTVTVTDAGGAHAGMTGQAETIVSPLELFLKSVGEWGVNTSTGNWENFTFYSNPGITSNLVCQSWYYGDNPSWYRYPYNFPNLSPSLYKIEIPPGSHINKIDIIMSEFSGSKSIIFFFSNPTPPPPPDIPAEINIDYSFNSPAGSPIPIGEYNLIHDVIGGYQEWSSGYYPGRGDWSQLTTRIPARTLIKTIPIPNSDIETVWISVYFVNIQSMVEQIEPYAKAAECECQIGGRNDHNIISIYGYE